MHVCINREPLISQLPNKAGLDFTIGNGGHVDPDPIWVICHGQGGHLPCHKDATGKPDHRRAMSYQGWTIIETGKQAKVLSQNLPNGSE